MQRPSTAPRPGAKALVLLGLILGVGREPLLGTESDAASCSVTRCAKPMEAIFVIQACAGPGEDGEVFRVLTRDPAVIAEAEALAGVGKGKIVAGSLRAGDGGVNAPWSWHLAPESLVFVDATVELCDGCPSFVEADLEFWLGSVGQFCPWSTEVLARER